MIPLPTDNHTKAGRGILTCLLTLQLLFVVLISLPQNVHAHSQPLKLEPNPGATLSRSPSEIRLTFAEPILPNANINLFPQDSFSPIMGIVAQQDPVNPAQIFALLPSLSSGTYTVQWQIQSSDGHTLTGTYVFTIQSAIWIKYLPWLALLIVLLATALIIRRRRQIL